MTRESPLISCFLSILQDRHSLSVISTDSWFNFSASDKSHNYLRFFYSPIIFVTPDQRIKTNTRARKEKNQNYKNIKLKNRARGGRDKRRGTRRRTTAVNKRTCYDQV